MDVQALSDPGFGCEVLQATLPKFWFVCLVAVTLPLPGALIWTSSQLLNLCPSIDQGKKWEAVVTSLPQKRGMLGVGGAYTGLTHCLFAGPPVVSSITRLSELLLCSSLSSKNWGFTVSTKILFRRYAKRAANRHQALGSG